MMAPLKFNDVSLDVKRMILGYIIRPTDLKSLCLACKELRDLATPSLYRRVSLFVGGQKDMRLSAFLGRDNPGVQHVREIYLRLEKTTIPNKHRRHYPDDSSEDEDIEEEVIVAARQAQFTVRLLLDFLPPNILEVFSWQSWEPFSVDNWLRLCEKQQGLRAVEIGPMDRLLAPVLESRMDVYKNFKNMTSLDIYPDTRDRLKACQMLLEANPSLENLCLASGFEYSDEEPDDLHDLSTRAGLLSRTLFSHMQPFESCTPMVLRDLSMDKIELRYAADTYLKVIKFSSLEILEIRDCAGADAVFAQLSKPHLRPSKLKSLRWMHEDSSEPYALAAFEGLLEALSGLKILHIDINHMDALPKVAALTHHGKTLTSLSVHSQSSSTEVHNYENTDYGEICNECTELRQLSVIFPSTTVAHADPSPDFKTFLINTHKLRYLSTLNIRRWPATRESFVGSYSRLIPTSLDLYEHQLQRMAQRIFEASDERAQEDGYGLGTRSMLSVIAFGGNGKSLYEGGGKVRLKQIPFVRGLKMDPFEQRSMMAVKTSWRMVQFVEADSDILNHSLYDLHDVHNGP